MPREKIGTIMQITSRRYNMNDRFIGELTAANYSIMAEFQAAALKCGMAITIMPGEDGTYRIEFMRNETEDT